MNNAPHSEVFVAGGPCADGSPPRVVILLTFDRLSAHAVSSPAAATGSGSVFRRFELQSTFFEQHYSQDLCQADTPCRTFGTMALQTLFQRQLDAAGVIQQRVVLGADSLRHSVAHRPHALDTPACSSGAGMPPDFLPAAAVPSHLAASDAPQFLWIHAAGCDTEQTAADNGPNTIPRNPGDVLRDVLALRDQLSQDRQLPVALVVTSCRGGRKVPVAPFASQLAEDEVRVPLWIDPGDRQFCRVGSISGSFDILPTVAEMFGVPGDWHTASDVANTSETDSSLLPQSLLPLCHAPDRSGSRVLVIRTDTRMAVRSDHFLLVQDCSIPETRSTAATLDPAAAPNHTWLYVKPEDFWNVHDQAGVYQNVIPELSRHLPIAPPDWAESGNG